MKPIFATLCLEPLVNQELQEPIEVFAKEVKAGWEGWPAEWSPADRKNTPETLYLKSMWTVKKG